MHTLPCITDYADQHAVELGLAQASEDALDRRAATLKIEMAGDLEYLSDALSRASCKLGMFKFQPNPLYPNEPEAEAFLSMLRARNTLAIGQMLIAAIDDAIHDMAYEQAEREV